MKLTLEINSSTGRLNLRPNTELSLNPNRLSYLYPGRGFSGASLRSAFFNRLQRRFVKGAAN
jgi:hypothetical protein